MLPYYYSYNEYMTGRFGEKVYKLSLDVGMTCPNRDGTVGTGGCIFCSEGGSGDFAQRKAQSIDRQIEAAQKQVAGKFKGDRFVAYFQSYTNTYAPVKCLRELFEGAVRNPKIVALSIGTRPDCLGEDVFELLKEINKIKPVFVELGLQTIHESTAQLINRCYSLPVFDEAVKNLKRAGINVVVHLILGLPHETREMMLESVKYVVNSNVDGIKLQLLHVLKGTRLEQMYLDGEFKALEKDEYVELVCECLKIIPNNIVIHRLTGDAPKNLLVAPLWSADKKSVLNSINRELKKR
jgi:radical SAM protein (TIGR01212 family)